MEWTDRLNESIRYIEAHLTEEIDCGRLGQIACCSAYHYQRMFVYMAGITLTEYIRRRRMSLAAVDLQNGGKVVDTALKYGYRSPTAFNRAFQAIHGAAPSAVQGGGVPVKSFPPLTFTIAVRGRRSWSTASRQKRPSGSSAYPPRWSGSWRKTSRQSRGCGRARQPQGPSSAWRP